MILKIDSSRFLGVKNAKEIAEQLEEIVITEQVSSDTKLPPIRALARTLSVSPSTIASAYSELERRGLAKGLGRAGTVVTRRNRDLGRARVFSMVPTRNEGLALDLSTGFPDPILLDDLHRRAKVELATTTSSNFLHRTVCDELLIQLMVLHEVKSNEITVVNGSLDALDRILEQTTTPSDRIVVEEPSYPPIFDLLEVHKLIPIPVKLDSEGVEPDSLAAALTRSPTAIIVQPRSQNPTGISMSATRYQELASIFAKSEKVTIIEDDHSGAISTSTIRSFRGKVPNRVINIHGFSKSHGPDLRISSIASDFETISALNSRRRLGPSWTSEIIQRILANLLSDSIANESVNNARKTYAKRLSDLAEALRQDGIEISSNDGLNAWIPVTSEVGAITDLARQGIVVAPGSAFHLDPNHLPHLRVTTAALTDPPLSLHMALNAWKV
ncbi:aminotransferase class I/II-fold pyridoxal phosphate-dependent enzyme [Acidithrix sp. C25]|uniref:aminotransferase-like domain-containing protein n=1 Tax=Acidithrix sp. C25 TaxID=1671482 RepID=UPI00191B992E|nr:aminotransferase class I/II-fold pyridoxal phosphate-dependent enzyme [Acidithrix sp. C25]CAG4930067.1 unnamed protein product [Acidithrix sp. C25]